MPGQVPPPGLSFIGPYLQRAAELQTREPVISYYCKLYAVNCAINSGKSRSPEATQFLGNLLSTLEQEKSSLEGNEAISNELVGKAYLETFALKIFLSGDNVDRAGKANRTTAKAFLAAANFLEVLKHFGPLDPEAEEKIRYAKWKATDILKALKEGRQPTPGPPTSSIENDDGTQNDQAQEGSDAKNDGQNFSMSSPHPDSSNTTGNTQLTSESNPSSTTATPYQQINPNPVHPNVNLYPNLPMPSPSTTAPYPGPIPPTQNNVYSTTINQPHAGNPSVAATVPAPAPVAPFITPSAPTQNNRSFEAIQSPLTPTSSASNAGRYSLFADPTVITQAQKHARYVISALEYDDIETAVDNLHQALNILAPYRHKNSYSGSSNTNC